MKLLLQWLAYFAASQPPTVVLAYVDAGLTYFVHFIAWMRSKFTRRKS